MLHVKFAALPEEKIAFERAAEINGMSLSGWIRYVLRKSSADDMKHAGEHAPFLPVPKEAQPQNA